MLVLVVQNRFEEIEVARGTIATVSELETLGLYTRLALRSVQMWSSLETRIRFHSTPDDVVNAVVNRSAAFGITYASQIPPDSPTRIKGIGLTGMSSIRFS